jgi:adenine-specific DNA-methyltransferase
MSMQDKQIQNRKKLQSLLRELFQFDYADLDFGIYRILNEKRDEIERFIEHDLLDAVEQGLAHFQAAERKELEAQLAEKRAMLGETALDETGVVREAFRNLPIAQDYMKLHHQLERLDVAEETEARIFNDLWRFFSRYYDNGDFFTERRYSSRESKFCVPYSGEEVLLHWANRDQYYVKTSERFTDYRFTAGPYTIWFRLQRAEVSQDNVKEGTRYFVPREEEPLAYDPETRVLTIFFEYRPITDEEEAHYLGVYNAQQTKSSRRKTLDRSSLCVALEVDVLKGLDDPDLKAHLAAIPDGQDVSPLGRHLNRYTARNTMDYFVHKDLGRFLRRELDFFLKNEVLRIDDVIGDETGEMMQHVLTRLRVVRQIAERIIAFLAQIEDFQKRLFEKKKFVVQTDYCITLDRVSEAFYPEILANAAQLEEWRQLYNVDTWGGDLFWQGEFDEAFLRNHPYLMLDTAFFDDGFKARLLATFDDLDATTDGLLVYGENFQALNLLQAKFGGQVKCIYIDPPYNTGNDEFIYKDNYRHSSWLTMMTDRLQLAHEALQHDGAIFISIDDNEVHRLNNLLRGLYGEDNSAALLIARTNPRGRTLDRYVAKTHEYVAVFVKKTLPTAISEVPKGDRMLAEYDKEDERGKYRELGLRNRNPIFNRENRPNLFFPIYVNPDTGEVALERSAKFSISVYPRNSRGEDDCWTWGAGKVAKNLDMLVGRQVSTGGWRIFRKDYLRDELGNVATTMVKSVWLDKSINNERGKEVLRDVIGYHTIDFPKSVDLIRKCIEIGATNNSLVLDFFAGSGTTAHAVMELNREDGGRRKYILVEMGDYFDTVLKPRIQRVAFSANWKDGVPQNQDGMSHMFKYQRIESYEDALNNICIHPPEGEQRRLLYDEFDDYMLHYMLDFETRESSTLLAPEAFEKPFQYTLKIHRGHKSPKDTVVDLVETFHYLIGMHVRWLERYEHQSRPYIVSRGEVHTERGVEKVAVIWRDIEGLDLDQEADWANGELLTEPVDRIYVNGLSHIDRAQPLEITFRELLEGGRRVA